MKTPLFASGNAALPCPENFSLALGGPLFQLFRWAHLSDDGLQLVRRRAVVVALFAWLPLLFLSTFERHLVGGSTTVPFMMDLEVHVRFLVAVPLLIGAELMVHERLRSAVRQFLERRLIPEDAMARFDAAIVSSSRL